MCQRWGKWQRNMIFIFMWRIKNLEKLLQYIFYEQAFLMKLQTMFNNKIMNTDFVEENGLEGLPHRRQMFQLMRVAESKHEDGSHEFDSSLLRVDDHLNFLNDKRPHGRGGGSEQWNERMLVHADSERRLSGSRPQSQQLTDRRYQTWLKIIQRCHSWMTSHMFWGKRPHLNFNLSLLHGVWSHLCSQ